MHELARKFLSYLKYFNQKHPLLVLCILLFTLANLSIRTDANALIYFLVVLLISLIYLAKQKQVLSIVGILLIVWVSLYISIYKQNQHFLLNLEAENFSHKDEYELLITEADFNQLEANFSATAIMKSSRSEGLKVYLSANGRAFSQVKVGQVLTVYSQARIIFSESMPNGFNEEQWLAEQGIYFRIDLNEDDIVEIAEHFSYTYKFLQLIYDLRSFLSNKFVRHAGEQAGGIAAAMIYGDRSYLDKDSEESFMDLGLAHVLVASGSNVGLALSLIDRTLNKFSLNEKARLIINIIVLTFLSVLSLGDIAITRATVMKIIELIYLSKNKRSNKINYLLVSIILFVLINPYYLLSFSMQLSFASSLAVYIFQEIKYKQEYKGRKKFKLLPAIGDKFLLYSLIQVFLLPLIYNGNPLSLKKIIANIVLLPLTELLLTWSFLFLLLSLNIVLASILGFAVRGIVEFLLVLFGVLEHFFVPNFNFRRIYFVVLFFLPWSKLSRSNMNDSLVSKINKMCINLAIVFIVIILCLMRSRNGVYFLDVGQGDSSIIIADSKTIMIDTGRPSSGNKSYDFLNYYEVYKIDYLIITHLDSDHSGGLAELLQSNIRVKNIVVSEYIDSDKEKFNEFVQMINKATHKPEIRIWRAGESYEIGKVKIDIIGPLMNTGNANNDSLVFMTRQFNSTIFWTGDIDKELESHYIDYYHLPQIEVLHAAHHGSKTGTSDKLLNELKPNDIVFSSSFHNIYRHPHPEVLARVNQAESKIYRTDFYGTIVLKEFFNTYKLSYTAQKSFLPNSYDKMKHTVKENN